MIASGRAVVPEMPLRVSSLIGSKVAVTGPALVGTMREVTTRRVEVGKNGSLPDCGSSVKEDLGMTTSAGFRTAADLSEARTSRQRPRSAATVRCFKVEVGMKMVLMV